MFQSTRPRGTRLDRRPCRKDGIAFQSTRPRGTRRRNCAPLWLHPRFNPRVREGRDSDPMEYTCPGILVSIHASARDATPHSTRSKEPQPVSIHASARDATMMPTIAIDVLKVSIHASARDATSPVSLTVGVALRFQSTRPRGTRLFFSYLCFPSDLVSIHASARDATQAAKAQKALEMFQSTRPRGTRRRKKGGGAEC